jgi:hypothetical protein
MMDFLLAALADFYRNNANAKKQVREVRDCLACPWLCVRYRLEGGGH